MVYFHILYFLLFGNHSSKTGRTIFLLFRLALYGIFVFATYTNAQRGQYGMMAFCLGVILILLAVDFRKRLYQKYITWRKKRAPVDYTKL